MSEQYESPSQPEPAQDSKPTKDRRWGKVAGFSVGALFFGVIIGSAGGNGDEPTTAQAAAEPAPTVTVTTQAKAKAEPQPVKTVKVKVPGPTKTVTKKVRVPGPTKTVTAKAEDPAASGSIDNDGTYLVGEDIQPGTYRTKGPEEGSLTDMCYYARLSGTSGELGDIIANGNPSGQTVVTISASDEAFETTGCQPWVRSD
ncbi:MAG: hypothetical protein ACRDQA_10045 [Nocardioidaceae bacterium]